MSDVRMESPVAVTVAAEAPADAVLVGVPVAAGASPPEGVDPGVLAATGFEGGLGQTALVPAAGRTVVLVGLGPVEGITDDTLRRAAAALVRASSHAATVATTLTSAAPAGTGARRASQVVAEGAALAAYRFTRYKGDAKPAALASVVLVGGDEEGARRGTAVAAAVALARDLINDPAGSLTPAALADAAVEVGRRAGVDVTVLDAAAIEQEGLGGLRGVSLGSDQPPRLIRYEWDPGGASATVAVVGKGITFDSGGLSLKPAEGMMTMKTDMSGAAAVLGVLAALPVVRPPVRVLGFVPATENLPGPKAVKPGDVLHIRNGKTVEVLNTDAEGRLVLADALSLAVEQHPDAIVDLATLTGACKIALGSKVAGVMGNDDGLVDQVREAGDRAGEPTWPLPLLLAYRKDIDSDVADIKNIGNPGGPGAITAGLFLQEFVDDVPWAHLDIAGPARADSDDAYVSKGGTGWGVRTVLELLERFTVPGAGGRP